MRDPGGRSPLGAGRPCVRMRAMRLGRGGLNLAAGKTSSPRQENLAAGKNLNLRAELLRIRKK